MKDLEELVTGGSARRQKSRSRVSVVRGSGSSPPPRRLTGAHEDYSESASITHAQKPAEIIRLSRHLNTDILEEHSIVRKMCPSNKPAADPRTDSKDPADNIDDSVRLQKRPVLHDHCWSVRPLSNVVRGSTRHDISASHLASSPVDESDQLANGLAGAHGVSVRGDSSAPSWDLGLVPLTLRPLRP